MSDHHHHDDPTRGMLQWLAGLVGFGWIAAVAYVAWRGWPHVPLDISATDPATQAAHRAAVVRHAMTSAATALVPAALLIVLARLIGRGRS